MKYVATVAVMLTLGVPGVYAQERASEDDVFGNQCGHHDQSTPRHHYRRTPVSRAWFARSFHLSGAAR